ncbi:MAG: protease family protein [Chloroflexota bacterium]|nr:protease family protein [Chloroflexota bacterium]
MKETTPAPQEKTTQPALWKIITMFALLFLAVELIGAGLGVGVNLLMRALNAGQNVRVFIGNTLTRGGMIAAALILTSSMLTSVLKQPAGRMLLPRRAGWGKDLLAGLGIAAAGMAVVFLLELALGWIRVEGLALSALPWDAVLRALWLALLANATAAVAEETLFRGFLFTGLKEAWDTAGALLVSAIIFSSVHILANAADGTQWTKLIPMVTLVGVLLGWAYLRTGNLWLPVGLHFAWNLFQDDVFNLNAHNVSDTLIGLQTSASGPGWFAGTAFGIEVGAAGVLATLLCALGVWLYTRNRQSED